MPEMEEDGQRREDGGEQKVKVRVKVKGAREMDGDRWKVTVACLPRL